MLDILDLKYKILHFPKWLFGYYKPSGYEPTPYDYRDYKIGRLFGGEKYEGKHDEKILKTLSIKDQRMFNTCVFNSGIAGKEIDEDCVLSVRSVVAYASRNGLLSGNGFSNLRNLQQILKDFGAMEEKDLADGAYSGSNDFSGYVNAKLNQAKAETHKIKSYWSVSVKEEIIRLIDEGRPVYAAMLWFSGYNRSGGFSHPWLITKTIGYQVGGHAVLIIGYKKNYYGRPVFVIQNSYSKQWGDNGCFYVDMGFMINEISRMGYGAYANLDLDSDVGAFLNQYDGKNVKSPDSPTIYSIQQGKKKPYLHELDYFVYNVEDSLMKNFYVVDSEILNKVPTGDNMDITKSAFWPALKYLDKPLNLTRVIEAIKSYKS